MCDASIKSRNRKGRGLCNSVWKEERLGVLLLVNRELETDVSASYLSRGILKDCDVFGRLWKLERIF